MAGTIIGKTKGKAKERPKDASLIGTKEGKKLILLVVEKLFHP
jgi:hypothetical protein